MYVVKVGDYYVRYVDYFLSEIKLSKEIMRSFTKFNAETIAKKVNGLAIEMAEEVTNEDTSGDNNINNCDN